MLKLHLRQTDCEIMGRRFVIREMNAPDQEQYYGLIARVARHQIAWEEANKAGTQESQEAVEAKQALEAANLMIWQMMLHPTGNESPVDGEWVRQNTNGRFGDEVIAEQMRLNNFQEQMGKASARAAATIQQAAPSPGPIFAAASVGSTT